MELYDKLDSPDQDELREHFNTVTTDDELGTYIFDKENSNEDVKAKLNALDDEDQEKFASAVKETRLISILSTEDSENPE